VGLSACDSSRSLSHADGPLWAALLKTARCDDAVVASFSSLSSIESLSSNQSLTLLSQRLNARGGEGEGKGGEGVGKRGVWV